MKHALIWRLGEVMHMGTFGKSVIKTFKDAQLKILEIFCDYTDKVNFFQYFMTRLMKKISMNFSFYFLCQAY